MSFPNRSKTNANIFFKKILYIICVYVYVYVHMYIYTNIHSHDSLSNYAATTGHVDI